MLSAVILLRHYRHSWVVCEKHVYKAYAIPSHVSGLGHKIGSVCVSVSIDSLCHVIRRFWTRPRTRTVREGMSTLRSFHLI